MVKSGKTFGACLASARGEEMVLRMPKQLILPVTSAVLLAGLLLGGCTPEGSPNGLFHYDPEAMYWDKVTEQDKFDMKLQHAETSPIPGATATVLAPPPGITYSGAPVGNCVTEAGYCPLAAQTEPGQNCLCKAPTGNYGGTTGIPAKYNTKENPDVY